MAIKRIKRVGHVQDELALAEQESQKPVAPAVQEEPEPKVPSTTEHDTDDLHILTFVRRILKDPEINWGHTGVQRCLVVDRKMRLINDRARLNDFRFIVMILAQEGYF